jgi:hypothetical protein
MPVYNQMAATYDGQQISTIYALTTDSTTPIMAHHNYGYAL